MLDGRVYQITGDGVVREVTEPAASPFACVTFYTPASHDDLTAPLEYDALLDWLLTLLPSPNLFYALRIEGRFADVRVRSVPRQERSPTRSSPRSSRRGRSGAPRITIRTTSTGRRPGYRRAAVHVVRLPMRCATRHAFRVCVRALSARLESR